MNRRAWWATVHGGRKESDTTERLIRTIKKGFTKSDIRKKKRDNKVVATDRH